MDQAVKKHVEYERTIAMLRTTKKAGKLISMQTALKITGTTNEPDHLYHAVRRSMEEDKAANRPFIASFIVGNNNQPIPQYFTVAKELGYDIGNTKQFWQEQLQQLGVSNVSNIIRTLNSSGRNQPHQQPGQNGNGHRHANDPFSSETKGFYGKNLTSSVTPDNSISQDNTRTRGRRGGRGRSRSNGQQQPVI
jgi:hypothetical protein